MPGSVLCCPVVELRSRKALIDEAYMAHSTAEKNISSPVPGGTPRVFLRYRFSSEGGFLCAGIACLFAWIDMLFCHEGILRDNVMYGGGVVHDPVLLAATISAALFLLLVRSFSKASIWIASIIGVLAAFAGTVLSWFVAEGSTPLYCASVLIGIAAGYCIARLTLAWSRIVSGSDMRRVFIPICTAFYVQWIPLIPIAWLGLIPRAFIAVALPVLSLLCFMRCRQVKWDCGHGSAYRSDKAEKPGKRSIRTMMRIALALLCFSCVFQFAWTFNILGGGNPLDSEYFWLVFTCVTGITALVMVGIALLIDWAKAYRVELLYRAAFVFGIIGVCSLGLLESSSFLSYTVSYIAYALIMPAAWMLAWSVAFMERISSRRAFGIIFSMQYLGFFLGFLLAKACESFGAYSLPLLVLVCAIVVSVAYSVVLSERTILSLSPRLFGLSHDSIDARCHDLAAHKGLTKREIEVLSLLARGRDVSWIEEKLFISRNTVNTHRKNIYKKLGVHTQQELLSLIEEAIN